MKALIALVLMMLATSALADPSYSGSVSVVFKDPILSGQYIMTDGTLGSRDNSTTYVASGMGTNAITWGACPETPVPPDTTFACGDNGGAPRFSALSFAGATFTGIAPETPFRLGTFTFTNGTSRPWSSIFGVTTEIRISLADTSDVVVPRVVATQLWATSNRPVPPDANAAWNADFVYFIAEDVSFNVLEGATAKADLWGMIVGDPTLEFTKLEVTTPATGYIASGPSDYGIPAPGTLVLLGIALASLGVSRLRG